MWLGGTKKHGYVDGHENGAQAAKEKCCTAHASPPRVIKALWPRNRAGNRQYYLKVIVALLPQFKNQLKAVYKS